MRTKTQVIYIIFSLFILASCSDSDSSSRPDSGGDAANIPSPVITPTPQKPVVAPLPSDLPSHQDINHTQISQFLVSANVKDCENNKFYYTHALSKKVFFGKDEENVWRDAIDITLFLYPNFTYKMQFLKYKSFKSTVGGLEYVEEKQEPTLLSGEWFATYSAGIHIPNIGSGSIFKYVYNGSPRTDFTFAFSEISEASVKELMNRDVTFNYSFIFTPIKDAPVVLKFPCP